MKICGFRWWAKFIEPDGRMRSVETTCCLEHGHAGDHVSKAKVMHFNHSDKQ